MNPAKMGDRVRVHYVAKLTSGSVFDTSITRDPLELTIGEGGWIPGLEEALVGMRPGESKYAEIPADQAYGKRYKSLLIEVDRSEFPEPVKLEAGQPIHYVKPDGQGIVVIVREVSDLKVILDANHPLAEKDITLDIRLLDIL